MYRYILFLFLVSSSYAQMWPSYKPHTVSFTKGKGFSLNTSLKGNNPLFFSEINSPSLPDRIDKFEFSVSWRENPPLTPLEATWLKDLETWASKTDPLTNPKQFAKLVYFQNKVYRYLKTPIELEINCSISHVNKNKQSYVSSVVLSNFEMIVDLSTAPIDGYFPGLPIGHKPLISVVNQTTVSRLQRPWINAWQPIALRGVFQDQEGNGDIVLNFRRHNGKFIATGSLRTDNDLPMSIISNAYYNGEVDCITPYQAEPIWWQFLNFSTNNWANNPVDHTRFNLKYATYGYSGNINRPLPNYNR